MRELPFVAAILLSLAAGVAVGNPYGLTPYGDIDLFADAAGYNEIIYATVPTLVSIYVVHVGDPQSTVGSEFWAPKPPCFNATWLGDANQFPVAVGNSQTGVSVGYGICRSVPVHVLTMNYFVQGLTGNCCYYGVHPHPLTGTGEILSVDCQDNLVAITGGYTIINPVMAGGRVDCPVAVEPSSWGRLKSLYAD